MAKQEPIEDLIDATVSLFHKLRAVVEEVHGGDDLAAGKRGVLKGLHENGPQTVPYMARARPVSRQHIQSLVNPLLEEGYVELIDNPHHERSKLVRLTDKGASLVKEMKTREARIFDALAADFATKEIIAATDVLDRMRQFFEGDWQSRLSSKRKARRRK